nr:hypothetical protein N8D75_02235 [Curtobacterium flaccumfaciens]
MNTANTDELITSVTWTVRCVRTARNTERMSCGYATPPRASSFRDGPPQQHGEDDRDDGGERVDRAPPERVRDQTADRPRHQDAGEHPGRDRADHASALRGVGEVPGQRDEELPGDRGDPDQRQGDQERREGRCDRGEQQRDGGGDEHPGDQAPAVEDVPERHDEQDADGVADLGQGDEQPGERRRGAERRCDVVEQRLCPVQVADRCSPGDGEQQGPAGRHRVVRGHAAGAPSSTAARAFNVRG